MFWRGLRTARHMRWQRFPDAAWAKLAERAENLPRPDPRAAPMQRAAEHVRLLNAAVEADPARGRFVLMGESFDFGRPEDIDWRGDFREGDNPLRRMTLAYLGSIFRTDELKVVERMVESLEAGNPFGAPGTLRDVWNPYAASHRLINLMAWMALRKRPDARLIQHVRMCAALILADAESDLGYNHLLKNYVAIAVYGFALRPKQLSGAVAECFLPDGAHAERSPMYHALGVSDLRILRELGHDVGAALERAEDALAAMCHPDGDIALFGDSWIGGAPRAADMIAVANEPAELPYGGYVKLAGGGDAVILDCGAAGPDRNPAHAHADFLAIELSVAGARVIVDPGVATYTAGPERFATRAAESHNGPFAGAEPLELWGSFRVGRRTAAHAIDDEAFEGFAPQHAAGALPAMGVARWIGLWPGRGLLVCDIWRRPRAARSRFLLARDIEARAVVGTLARGTGTRYASYGKGESCTALTVAPEGGRAAVWFGWGGTPPAPDSLAPIFAALERA
jgi:hypothetical protein